MAKKWRQYVLTPVALALCITFAYGHMVMAAPLQEQIPMQTNKTIQLATLAGGCFWCVEADMRKIPGVVEVISGYAGGSEENPSYEQVASGRTGHREAVQVHFDSTRVNFNTILDVFWRHIDPTDEQGSFGDRGFQYTSAIFFHTEQQRHTAEQSIKKLDDSGRFSEPIITEVIAFSSFYPAEEYHQKYSEKNPKRYESYRFYSGRDRFTKRHWEKPSCPLPQPSQKNMKPKTIPEDSELKQRLSPLQYMVVREQGTEPPFTNTYWNNSKPGIYVDVVSGEPLFSSTDKYDSGSGWPSFMRPLVEENIIEQQDNTLFTPRTEVRSREADSHLGHVFGDGPAPTGLRYCINSAAMRFIPKEKMKEEGYEKFLYLFQ